MRQLAKNTVFLYLRMFILLAAGLVTSRVVLKALGAEELGIYSAVAGLVSLFTLLTGSLTVAIGRFITFELGRGEKNLKTVFSTSVIVQLILSAAVIVLVETVGLWWVRHGMVIPQERIGAACIVLQFVAVSLVAQLVSVPYNAAIVAYERMDAFAYISILEGAGKLAVAFLIAVSPFDKLIFYSLLLALVSVLVRLAYGIFCRRSFPEVRFTRVFDKEVFKKMFSFAGWTFAGSGAFVAAEHGGNMLINFFSGPVANAAWLLSVQVKGAVEKFADSFTTAIKPQITKSFAQDRKEQTRSLVFTGSRVSVFLLLLVVCPLFFSAGFLTEFWLGKGSVPPGTVAFIRLALLDVLARSVSFTLGTFSSASGDVRNYQLTVGGIILLNIPIDFILLKMGAPAYSIFAVALFLDLLCIPARLLVLRRQFSFPAGRFFREVLLNEALVVGITFGSAWALTKILPPSTWAGCLLHMTASVLIAALACGFVGLKPEERRYWLGVLMEKLGSPGLENEEPEP